MTNIKLISAADTLYSDSLLKSFNEQRNSGLFCDVTVIVQDRKFRAHRNILSASSSYFHQLFSVAGQVIELNFIKADIFEEILNYIYSSKIIRVRSDTLEDLIKSGQTLGVKFIANLGLLLSHVKGLPGLSKEEGEGLAEGTQASSMDTQKKNGLFTQESGSEAMPIITEAFSLSAEEPKQKPIGEDKGGDSDDDVLFVSEQKSQSTRASGHVKKSSEVIDVDELSAAEESRLEDRGQEVCGVGAVIETAGAVKSGKPPAVNLEGPVDLLCDTSSDSSTLSEPIEELPEPSTTMPSPHFESVSSSSSSLLNAPTWINGSLKGTHKVSLLPKKHDVIGVQKKQVITVLEKTSGRPGDFKIKLSDVMASSSPRMTDKKTFTLDPALGSDSMFAGCKVHDDHPDPDPDHPGEGECAAKRTRKSLTSSPQSPGGSPTESRRKRKAKGWQEDHYKLIMDGKTFYMCIVCKRPYVCLTSLRRHFNVHSWEKEYPCRYCDKVFALAEYRTKHEIQHTGERRYQCLLCGAFFISYQLLSTHCKQAHNKDPSGKKGKDEPDDNLYRLLPCRTLELKASRFVSEDASGIPMINEEGLVYHLDPTKEPIAGPGSHSSGLGKVVNWDDIFVESGTRAQEGTSEFEFVIPETF